MSEKKPGDIAKKAKFMTKATEDFRKEFKLTKPEAVIQCYACSLSGFNRGTLYISQNYVCFKSTINSRTERLPFTKIVSVEYTGSIGKTVTIKNDRKEFAFSSFSPKHAKEAYILISYLRANPPSYVDSGIIKQHDEEVRRESTSKSQSATNQNGSGGQTQVVQERTKVDTAAGDMLLALALETDDIQNNVLKTVAEQGEQIDRIEEHMDRIDGNLKRADHLMKGIESLPYYIFGGSSKKESREKREKVLKDRTIKIPKGAPPVFEIEIVYKFTDDSLIPAILVLDQNNLSVINPDNDKPIEKGASFTYDSIDKIVMRARHEHMDVRFTNKAFPRIRLMSSYCQIITNQLYLRCKEKKKTIPVEFEPGVQKFDYEDEKISKIPPRQRGGKGLLIQNTPTTSSLLSTASQETRDDMDRVDKQLDQVYGIVVGMEGKARVLNEEIVRQTEQLGHIEIKVDNATEKTKQLNQRIDKQLK